MALRYFWYNFALEYILFIKLRYDWSLVYENISDGGEKDNVKINKLIRLS